VDIYFSVCFKGTVESSSYNDGMLDFRFGDAYVEAYAGFSLVGANEAASRAKSARDLGFDGVESATRTEWERQLSRIDVDFGDAGFRPLFYSTLYHSLLKPVDCGGG
jgi:putative alpha-1,2-mannosidase